MATKPEGTSLPINRAEVLDRIGGDPEFLKELLGIYEQDFFERAEELRKAVRGEQFEVIRSLGHSLKGASANLSLPGLQQASRDLEVAGQERDIVLARTALAALEKEFQRLKEFLSQSPV